MSRQLDILALEPFHGGCRRLMMDTIVRHSRHRWTVLKLPARRMERRLTAAAHWFAEILARRGIGKIDAIFASDALNLADLRRLVPTLADKPAVVYFHANQLPPPQGRQESPIDLINLHSAASATEIWFNSNYHVKSFVAAAGGLIRRHPELAMRNPLPALMEKAHVMPPPVDLAFVHEIMQSQPVIRKRRTVFLCTEGSHSALLNTAFRTLDRRGESYNLILVGSPEHLDPEFPRRAVSENDETAQVLGLLEAGVIVSASPEATADHHVIRALAAGCWPIVPNAGVYPEIIPDIIHPNCLYDVNADALVSRLLDAWHLGRPEGFERDVLKTLDGFDAINRCKDMDQRLMHLAG
jgi:hypothetical protein